MMPLKNSVGGGEGDDASRSESMTRNSPGAFTSVSDIEWARNVMAKGDGFPDKGDPNLTARFVRT